MRTNLSSTPQVGRNLRRLRESAGLSRRALAKASGTAGVSITQIELGTRGIGLGLAIRLAEALQCTVNDLAYLVPDFTRAARENSNKNRIS